MATELSLERCGIDQFDLLLLQDPDRIGFTSEAVWNGMEALRDAGLTRMIGVSVRPDAEYAPEVAACFARFGAMIDWAMITFSPLEPFPGEWYVEAAAGSGIEVICRLSGYGGLGIDRVVPHQPELRLTRRELDDIRAVARVTSIENSNELQADREMWLRRGALRGDLAARFGDVLPLQAVSTPDGDGGLGQRTG